MPTSAAIAAVGTAVSAYGAISSANAQSGAAKYNSEVAANNAVLEKRNADYAAAEGNAKTEAAEMTTRAKVGGILADQGASGVDINSGSSQDVLASTKQTGKLDALNIRAQAARQAYGYITGATSDDDRAALDKSEASNDETAGYVKAGSTLLTSGADIGRNLGGGSASPDGSSWGSYTDSKGISWGPYGG